VDEYYEYKEKFSPELCKHIREMERNGIISSDRQSEILKLEYGVEIPSYIIAEYKYRKRHEEAGI
jgi:hypothetical protein